jgi:hypothetical protein
LQAEEPAVLKELVSSLEYRCNKAVVVYRLRLRENANLAAELNKHSTLLSTKELEG